MFWNQILKLFKNSLNYYFNLRLFFEMSEIKVTMGNIKNCIHIFQHKSVYSSKKWVGNTTKNIRLLDIYF